MNFQKVAYKRVSAIDQNTDRQLDGMEFDKIFQEKISGKDRNRPQLDAMIQYVREGDHVYVHSMDRLARNLSDLLHLVNQITDKGCCLHFVSQSLEFSKDSRNPTANLMLQILGSIHEFELQIIHERQREGIIAAKAKGKYKSGRPALITDEKLQICKERIAQGVPIAKISKELKLSRSTIYRNLKHQGEHDSE